METGLRQRLFAGKPSFKLLFLGARPPLRREPSPDHSEFGCGMHNHVGPSERLLKVRRHERIVHDYFDFPGVADLGDACRSALPCERIG